MVRIEGQLRIRVGLARFSLFLALFRSELAVLLYFVLFATLPLHWSRRDEQIVNPIEVLRVVKTDFNLASTFASHVNDPHLGS